MDITNISYEELEKLLEEKKKEKYKNIVKEIEKLGEDEKEELKELLGWKVSYEWGGNGKVESLLNKFKIEFIKNKYNYEFSFGNCKLNCRNIDKVKVSFGRKVDINKMIKKLEGLGLKCRENYGIEVENLESFINKKVEIEKLIVSLK